jgi:uncharacterized protein (TIGR00255 family)
MIRSMTGFGEAERAAPVGVLRAEIRSVNHRHFSANLRVARGFERYDAQIREWLRGLLSRGHINYALRLERNGGEDEGVVALEVDRAKARQYLRALESLRDELGLAGEIDIALLSRFGDLIGPADDGEGVGFTLEDVRAVTEDAARATIEMREEEGKRLAADLEGRLAAVETALAAIEERAPDRLIVERNRMRRVVADLLDGVVIDDERIAREIALIAERWDISEEIVRLRSHIELFRGYLDARPEEPVGKRLGFLIQEMNRETNTIGSKANDAPIEHGVIQIKDEIERLREQVENIE